MSQRWQLLSINFKQLLIFQSFTRPWTTILHWRGRNYETTTTFALLSAYCLINIYASAVDYSVTHPNGVPLNAMDAINWKESISETDAIPYFPNRLIVPVSNTVNWSGRSQSADVCYVKASPYFFVQRRLQWAPSSMCA